MLKEITVKALDLSQVLKPYENKWVALSPDKKKVSSSGNSLKEVFDKLDSEQQKKVSVMKVLPLDIKYAPSTL